jgi:predicted DNA-binding transcriptional regulator YafY
MRRADRLFQIVLSLRRRRITTARDLARTLEVSERTIYRDVQELSACGLPIEGAAGVGYRLGRGFDLPPMMFDCDELQALRLGARMVRSWADPDLSEAAERPAQDRSRVASRPGSPRRGPLRPQSARAGFS